MENQNREKKLILRIILQKEIESIKFPLELSTHLYKKIIEKMNSS